MHQCLEHLDIDRARIHGSIQLLRGLGPASPKKSGKEAAVLDEASYPVTTIVPTMLG